MPTAEPIALWGRVARGLGWPGLVTGSTPGGWEGEFHHLKEYSPLYPKNTGWLLFWNKFSELLVAGSGLVFKEVPGPVKVLRGVLMVLVGCPLQRGREALALLGEFEVRQDCSCTPL